MEMAMVRECDACECSYNAENMCHALAITIGDDANPMCDTFCQSDVKGGDSESMAGVGACKVSCCSHNSSLECQCPEIEVGHQGSGIGCLDFSSM